MTKCLVIPLLIITSTFVLSACSKKGTSNPSGSGGYFIKYSIGGQGETYTKRIYGVRTKDDQGNAVIEINALGDTDNSDGFVIYITGTGAGNFPFTYDLNSNTAPETIFISKTTNAQPVYITYFNNCSPASEMATQGSITITSAAADPDVIEGSFTGYIAPYTSSCGPTFKPLSGSFRVKRVM